MMIQGVLCCCLLALSGDTASPAKERLDVQIRVDLGRDVGQHFGSLFEMTDAAGKVVAGAGFLGVYNTEARSDRHTLHAFVKPARPRPAVTMERLPRPIADSGVYLHEFDRQLFARGRGSADRQLRVWDPAENRWTIDQTTAPFSVKVGHGVLVATSSTITYDGAAILQLGSHDGQVAENYYANGWLVFRLRNPSADPVVNRMVACAWSPDPGGKTSLDNGRTIELRSGREFVYAFGQWGEHVLAATNTGGVYRFDGGNWQALVEPIMDVSYQVYSMINHYDKLLLGHYPTGNLLEYDGTAIRRLEDWPPVMPGVSNRAREAQTTTIYGGDLHVGVWPWGEIWRYDRGSDQWSFVARPFTQPEPTDAIVHPYDVETSQRDRVANLWGQRVTSMIPVGGAMLVSTSSKGGGPFDPKFDFLSERNRIEYGSVVRYRTPGHLSAPIAWKNGPTTLRMRVKGDALELYQDGQLVGKCKLGSARPAKRDSPKIEWGMGVYGPLRGKILEKRFERK